MTALGVTVWGGGGRVTARGRRGQSDSEGGGDRVTVKGEGAVIVRGKGIE